MLLQGRPRGSAHMPAHAGAVLIWHKDRFGLAHVVAPAGNRVLNWVWPPSGAARRWIQLVQTGLEGFVVLMAPGCNDALVSWGAKLLQHHDVHMHVCALGQRSSNGCMASGVGRWFARHALDSALAPIRSLRSAVPIRVKSQRGALLWAHFLAARRSTHKGCQGCFPFPVSLTRGLCRIVVAMPSRFGLSRATLPGGAQSDVLLAPPAIS